MYMRRICLAALSIAFLCDGGHAEAKKKRAGAKRAEVMTGDALPSKRVKNKACKDDGGIRWLGSEPTTPFAIVKKNVETAGQACCAPWARKGDRYKTVDAYGQIVGEAEISGGAGYDVTQCYELSMSTKTGSPGVGIFVSRNWSAPKSAAWSPTPAEIKALIKISEALDKAMVPPVPYKCEVQDPLRPFAQRSLFFEASDDHEDVHKWAVVGGRMLLVARLYFDGSWIAHYTSTDPYGSCFNNKFSARAVFDMNEDGKPEIIVHENFGDSFGDVVLGLDAGRFSIVAEAVHGSTA